jgi:hypothetical protein
MPSASYVAYKNLAVSAVTTGLCWWIFSQDTGFRFRWKGIRASTDIAESLIGFSLWSHLVGIATDIVYRADIVILGWFRGPLRVAGNYNVALQLSNMTKILPQILQTNSSLAISRLADSRRKTDEVVWLFLKGSVLLSLATMAGYAMLGKVAIGVIAKSDVNEIFWYGWWIMGGLSVFNVARPLYSYVIIAKSVRSCLLYLSLPSCVFAVITYYVGARVAGAQGLAIANLVNGLFMMLAAVVYVAFWTDFKCPWALLTDIDRSALRVSSERCRALWYSLR